MNKLFSFAAIAGLLIIFATGCNSNKNKKTNFTLDVTVKNAENADVVYLKDYIDGKWVALDSAKLQDGKGEIKGYVESPKMYYFFYNTIRLTPIFVEPGNITLNTDKNNLRDITIEGSVSNKQYETFMREVNGAIDEQIQKLGGEYGIAQKNGDSIKMDSLMTVYEGLEANRKDEMIKFAQKNTKSVVPAFIIYQFSYQFELPELEKVANSFDSSIKDNEYVKNLIDRVTTLKRVQIGQPFIDFTQNDTNGNPVSLSSIVKNNKYVLVDFWAAWCRPCRAENPNVLNAFKKYHDKGFTVFGVSFDKTKEDWIKAIKDDGLLWTQVSDLKGWGNEAGKLYGIQSIPQNILIGPDGKIIARNIRGEELQSKLKELMP